MSAKRFVINVRGAGGSGKTTLVRHVLANNVRGEPLAEWDSWEFAARSGGSKGDAKPARWPIYKCQVPGLELPIYVQGSYTQQQGGMDTCKDMDAIEVNIRRAAMELTDGHILFEGMMVSGSGERWASVSQWVPKDPTRGEYLWVFLRLQKEEMIRRIMQRNGGKELKVQYMDENVKKQERSRRFALQINPSRLVHDLDPLKPAAEVYGDFVALVARMEAGA